MQMSKGNGRRKHLWCHRALIIRRLLALLRHRLDTWRIPDRRGSRRRNLCAVPEQLRFLPDGAYYPGPSLTFPNRVLTNWQGWFIFTFLLVICTLRSTVAFFLLFFTLDMAFLLLGIGYLKASGPAGAMAPNTGCIKAGGAFAILAAFLAWYNALAGIADSTNRSVNCFFFFADVTCGGCNSLLADTHSVLASSSSPSRTSPGRTRVANAATRSTTARRAPTRPSRTLTPIPHVIEAFGLGVMCFRFVFPSGGLV